MKKFVVLMLVVSVVLSVFAFASAKNVDNRITAGTSRFTEFAKLMKNRMEYAEHQGVFDIPSFSDNEIEYRAHKGIYSGVEDFQNTVKYAEHRGQFDIQADEDDAVTIDGLLSGNKTREDVYAALEANGNFFCSNNNNYLLCKAKDAGEFETITYYFNGDILQSVEYKVLVK